MDFALVADIFEKMEKTSKRLELTDYLVELFRKTPADIIDKVVYLIQGKIKPDYEGVELGVADKMIIKAIALSSGLEQSKIEQFYRDAGDIGYAGEEALKQRQQMTLFQEKVDVEKVYSILEKIASLSGEGSQDLKIRYLCNLLNNATPKESRYILRIVAGKLRLGIADYTILDALSIAFTNSKENRSILEHAYNISSDLGLVAKLLATKGLDAVKNLKVSIFKPIRPMLAERVSTPQEALEKTDGICAAEYKLDGERVQIHKKNDKVMLFSRRLENITSHYPDAIEAINKYIDKDAIILEAEIVAIDQNTGEYLPFQELMHRRRKYGIEEAMKEYPVALNFFDILYFDKECLDMKYKDRRRLLEDVISEVDNIMRTVPMIIASDADSIEKFMEQAISEGCEGLMIKNLNSGYRAGAREYAWIKLKREYRGELADSLDLVIVGAYYGRGRRAGKYGAFLLAAYDDQNDMFRSISKIGTGFSDEDLDMFYKMLEQYKLKKKDPRVDSKLEADVWFEPKIVIEVIASEITLSPLHTCAMNSIRKDAGLALRFPKFTGRVRDDKRPEDATTVREVIDLYNKQKKVVKE
ncbi:MAG: ATP-dependent DNA ligase [Candidatus Nitrosothermus koennekii]|nr:MAG: ATP-dependent DNA ligase [Candidatus Nitrosothermus koennekii]